MLTCTRRIEFDAAHRLVNHEGKCRHLHGHRYVVDITCESTLDSVGRVVDFGVVKQLVGGWVDETLDHGTILNETDTDLVELCERKGWKFYRMQVNPTVENLARLIHNKSRALLIQSGVEVTHVRVYETPNGWADSWL